MEIERIMALKAKVEHILQEQVREQMELFRTETGVSISAVDVDILSIQMIGQERRHSILNRVRIGLDFEAFEKPGL